MATPKFAKSITINATKYDIKDANAGYSFQKDGDTLKLLNSAGEVISSIIIGSDVILAAAGGWPCLSNSWDYSGNHRAPGFYGEPSSMLDLEDVLAVSNFRDLCYAAFISEDTNVNLKATTFGGLMKPVSVLAFGVTTPGDYNEPAIMNDDAQAFLAAMLENDDVNSVVISLKYIASYSTLGSIVGVNDLVDAEYTYQDENRVTPIEVIEAITLTKENGSYTSMTTDFKVNTYTPVYYTATVANYMYDPDDGTYSWEDTGTTLEEFIETMRNGIPNNVKIAESRKSYSGKPIEVTFAFPISYQVPYGNPGSSSPLVFNYILRYNTWEAGEGPDYPEWKADKNVSVLCYPDVLNNSITYQTYVEGVLVHTEVVVS